MPLKTYDRVLGAIVMVNTSEGRMCGTEELALAEELAQRAALAIDNASLYKAAQKARAESERANLAKDSFLAMLSHELRTPLTPVLTSVLALEQSDGLPEEVRGSLQMIRRNVELEARLIDDLLDLTRISKGKVQLNLEEVDAHSLLRNALEICQADIDKKNLSLSTDFAAENVCLDADPARLQQIFWNLIKNAVKFTPEGGRLEIRTQNNDGQLRVQVSDSGMGIDAETLPKIFNAFEQGDRTQLGGLGLGLAISKALVETHNGKLTAESAGKNQGATFTAMFPVAEHHAGASKSAVPSLPAARKSMRILLVEDHEDTNRSLTHLLRRRGYHVQAARSVQSALEMAAAEQFRRAGERYRPAGWEWDRPDAKAHHRPPDFRNRADWVRHGRRCAPEPRGGLSSSPDQARGFEPARCAHPARQLSRVRESAGRSFWFGVPGGIRTPNLLIRSQLLYPVELQTHFLGARPKFAEPCRPCKPALNETTSPIGADRR